MQEQLADVWVLLAYMLALLAHIRELPGYLTAPVEGVRGFLGYLSLCDAERQSDVAMSSREVPFGWKAG